MKIEKKFLDDYNRFDSFPCEKEKYIWKEEKDVYELPEPRVRVLEKQIDVLKGENEDFMIANCELYLKIGSLQEDKARLRATTATAEAIAEEVKKAEEDVKRTAAESIAEVKKTTAELIAELERRIERLQDFTRFQAMDLD